MLGRALALLLVALLAPGAAAPTSEVCTEKYPPPASTALAWHTINLDADPAVRSCWIADPSPSPLEM